MFETLRFCYGENLKWEKWTADKKLMIYLDLREKYKFLIFGMNFVLVQISRDDQFGVIALQKQRAIYEEAYKCNVGFIMNGLTKRQKDSLILHRVPFISEPDQVYLPFMGVMINEHLKKQMNIKTDKMTPSTQLLFLYLLYNPDSYKTKSEMADELRMTRTSMTRASRQLKEMGLCAEKQGKLHPVALGREYYEMARAYLINPVQNKVTMRKEAWIGKCARSGETALAEYSMLNQSLIPTYAAAKNALPSDIENVDARWEDSAVVHLERWKYDPSIFARNGVVDVVSLACTLMDEHDERVQLSLDEMLEGYRW